MRRLALVTLIVPDYDEAILFFTRTLAFDLVQDRPDGAKRWVVVAPRGGGCGLLLARAADARQSRTIGRQAGGRVLLFLETDDLDRDRAHMEGHGIRFEEATRDEPYGRVAVFRDPWGNRWDLIQPPGREEQSQAASGEADAPFGHLPGPRRTG